MSLMKIKETVAKIIGIFTGAEDIVMASGEPGIRAKRSDTGVRVGFIIGAGGTNHGVYSYKLNKWMVYSDGTYTWFDNNAGGHYRWDMGTNNTTDTWVPVLSNSKLQHRVIPRGKTVQLVHKSAANQVLNANSAADFSIATPTLTGYTVVGLADVWSDSTGTTGATATDRIFCANHWGDTGATTYFHMRNLHSAQAKFTLNASWIFALNL